jgi:hypothetical protein
MEKCYRDIQSRGQIVGLSLLEVFVLLAVPILLFPFFTLLNLSFGIILVIEVLLYTVFRMAARSSHFDYGLLSLVYSRFIWPRRLSAYEIDEREYIKDNGDSKSQILTKKSQINPQKQKPKIHKQKS